jgi:hypothetical protein
MGSALALRAATGGVALECFAASGVMSVSRPDGRSTID